MAIYGADLRFRPTLQMSLLCVGGALWLFDDKELVHGGLRRQKGLYIIKKNKAMLFPTGPHQLCLELFY
jgi:hypothetical protein